MAMPQKDNVIEEIKRTDLLLEWAVQHGELEEAERLREKLRRGFFRSCNRRKKVQTEIEGS